MGAHGDLSGPVGDIDLSQFDPSAFLTHFDWGKEGTLESGQNLREWDVVAVDKEIEVAPGVFFPAWTFNNQVPGPTFRCNQGDRLRFHFTNAGSHPHTIHFHGFHPPAMDGITPLIQPGQSFHLRIRRAAVWRAPVPLPCHAAQAPYPQRIVRRIDH